MATIKATDVQGIADLIAAHIITQSALFGSPGVVQTAQSASLDRIAGLNDSSLVFAMLDAFEAAISNENAWINSQTSYNAILDQWFSACAVLDNVTGGLAAFLATNTLQVDPRFLDAFNRAVARGLIAPSKALSNYQAFGNVNPNLAQIAVTGSGVGTFTGGTAENAAYGNAPLYVYNAGTANTGAASATYTVTFSKYNSSGTLLTGQTATATVPNGTTPGTAIALSGSAAGVSVQNITLTGGTNGDLIAVKAVSARVVSYTDRPQVAVPMYIYPTAGGSDWNRLTRPPLSYVVMNPSSGPGTAPIADYVNIIATMRALGIKVIGYVDTNYSAVSLVTVKNQIDEYYTWYGVDGIFIDRNDNTLTNLYYYQQIYAYVKAKTGIRLLVANPGVQTIEAYMTACDICCNFEGDAATYTGSYTANPAWVANYPASRFWHIIYACADIPTMVTVDGLARSRNAGYEFITPVVLGSNPFGSLPTDPFWTSFLQRLSNV